jgi:DNA-binding winged helix-turn-helix (wHTH) protein/Tfp pilus assembly protein PilF
LSTLVFEPFALDPSRRRLTRAGEPVAVSERQLDVLLRLLAQPGQVVAKDDLIAAAWKDVAVADNSLEQAISALRRVLGTPPSGRAYIETLPRRGYRFGVAVERKAVRETDAGLDALLAPHRAFVEGRAALETLEAGQVARALQAFESAIAAAPDYAAAHVGLANALLMRFEMTRSDPAPDAASLSQSIDHAREACRLDARSAEGWATLGFVLGRSGARVDALAAAGRGVALEPDNWRHHFRLANIAWGEERLRAAHRTLALLPDFPLAHWLAATVYGARQVFDEAERELAAGLASESARAKFGAVALHWLRGLVHMARGDHSLALEDFQRELAGEGAGHLYSRECCANTWYALGVLKGRQGDRDAAAAAFHEALARIASHPMALVALDRSPGATSDPVALAIAQAAARAMAERHAEAARIVNAALSAAEPGNAGWLVPVEPTLHVTARPDIWADTLARLRHRAA